MGENTRGPWYLLTGLLIGLMIGVSIALIFYPVKFIDTAPDALSDTNKDIYRALIAIAFQSDQDIGRANARLNLLNDSDNVNVMEAQAQRLLANGESSEEAQALAHLAIIIDKQIPKSSPTPTTLKSDTPAPASSPSPIPSETPGETQLPSPSSTSEATITPTVEVTSTTSSTETNAPQETATGDTESTITPSPEPSFVLEKNEQICDPALTIPMIQVELYDSSGKPLSGVRVNVTWDNGEDNFFTGLHPEVNTGYADFEMTPDIKYTMRAGDEGETVTGITAVKCTSPQGSDYWGGWKLLFIHP